MTNLTPISADLPIISTRSEAEILLCCSRTCMDSKNAERLKFLLQADIDWEYLLQTAELHGMMPLLYWNLNSTCPEAVPKSTLDRLENSFYSNGGHNLALTSELLHLLNLLSAEEIPAFPYKGSVLAALAYGNLAFRQWGDLDILVPKQNVLKAKKLLISQGYRPLYELSNDDERAFLESRYSHPFVRDRDGISVDLHWKITKKYFPFPFDFERLWNQRKPISLHRATVFSPPIEDLLLILCVHASKHRWERLNWICDIAELIRFHQDMDWGMLLKQASSFGSQRMLFLGLFLAHELLETALPDEILQRIYQDSVVKLLAAQVGEDLFSETIVRFQESWVIEETAFYPDEAAFLLRLRERLQDRVPYFLHLAGNRWKNPVNQKDRVLLSLPTSLSFLYYCLRPIRLIREYLFRKSLLKHLLGL